MSDFSDRPFVAGSLTGLRSFGVDQYGRLTGVAYKSVWTPGENVAVCRKSAGGGLICLVNNFFMPPTLSWYNDPSLIYNTRIAAADPSGYTVSIPIDAPAPTVKPVSLVKKPKPKPPEPHTVAQLTCQCGFYGYFDGGANPHHEKGNVKGIVEGYGRVTVGTRGFRAEKAVIRALIIPTKKRTVVVVGRVIENYGVPVFASRAEALAAFPLTPPAVPSPATDADFWTRSAS